MPVPEREAVFASITEQQLARKLRTVLATTPIGGAFDESADLREILTSREFFIPEVLCEVHPEWNREALDGIYHEFARKTGENEAEIAGLCIFISDQQLTPVHVHLEIARDKDEIVWLELRLGELGPDGMVRTPYVRRRLLTKLEASDRWDKIEWVYHVGFGERTSPKPE